MKNKAMKLGVIGASGVLFATLGTGQASAASAYATCHTTGSSGSVNASGWNHLGGIPNITLEVYDEQPDGHHVAARLGVGEADGGYSYYAWHADYDGYGTYKSINTYMTSVPNGTIPGIILEVGTFEGSTLLHYCTEGIPNPADG